MRIAFASRLFLCLFVSVVANVTLLLLLLASVEPELAPNQVPAAPDQEPTTISESGVRWEPCTTDGWRYSPSAVHTELVGEPDSSTNGPLSPTSELGPAQAFARCQ